MKTGETADRLLDTAQALVQERGFNAFSYKDLAAAIGIRTASVHYHFPAKVDLGRALVRRYFAELEGTLAKIDREGGSHRLRLMKFIDLYRATESCRAICLCGSLASDLETLPADLRQSVSDYLARGQGWLADTIAGGVREGEFTFPGSAADLAATLAASLQGALLVARAQTAPPSIVNKVQRVFLAVLGVS